MQAAFGGFSLRQLRFWYRSSFHSRPPNFVAAILLHRLSALHERTLWRRLRRHQGVITSGVCSRHLNNEPFPLPALDSLYQRRRRPQSTCLFLLRNILILHAYRDKWGNLGERAYRRDSLTIKVALIKISRRRKKHPFFTAEKLR